MRLTLATKVTIGRIFLIIPAIVLYILAFYIDKAFLGLLIASCAVYGISLASDFIDGAIARKTHTVSDLGKFLDPLADKVVILIMLFLMVWSLQFTKYFPNGYILYPHDGLVLALLSGIIFTREIVISVFRGIAVKKNIVIAADIIGKFKTIFLDVGVAVLILSPVKFGPIYFCAWAGTIIFYIGARLTIISGINYLIKNRHVLADKQHIESEK